MPIHATALVDPQATIHETASIGAYSIIGPHVSIGAHTTVGPHCVIDGRTTIGEYNRIFQFASIGAPPQDLKYAGEPTEVIIGNRNQIREFTTIHLGTVQGTRVTKIGDDCLLMANSHVAHDCIVGNHVILANSVAVAGHVIIEDFVICGGLSGIHQFTRLGKHAFISGGAMVAMDIPPYCTAQGDRAELVGLNTVGLSRNGYTQEQISRIKSVYKVIFRSGVSLKEALSKVRAEYKGHIEIEHFVRFIEGSERGVTR